MSRECEHREVLQGQERPFNGPVYTKGVTEEVRAAHGNVTWREACRECGAERGVNANAGCREISAWGRSASQRYAMILQVAELAIKRANAMLTETNVRVRELHYRHAGHAVDYVAAISIDDKTVPYRRRQLEAASQRSDNEAEVRALFRALIDVLDAEGARVAHLHSTPELAELRHKR